MESTSEGSIKAFTEVKTSMMDSKADDMELEELVEQALAFLRTATLEFPSDSKTRMTTRRTAASKTVKGKRNTQRVVLFGGRVQKNK